MLPLELVGERTGLGAPGVIRSADGADVRAQLGEAFLERTEGDHGAVEFAVDVRDVLHEGAVDALAVGLSGGSEFEMEGNINERGCHGTSILSSASTRRLCTARELLSAPASSA